MSNPYSQAYENPQPNQIPPSPPIQSNGLGTAGFVVSLIGLLTCGVLSIFGLGLSLFGLGKNPKGFAIAGTIMGLIGLVELVFVGLFVYNMVQAVGTFQTAILEDHTESMARQIANEVADEWDRSKELPNEAEGQVFAEGETDLFDSGFRYETDGKSFTIRGAGADQMFDTEDDVTAGPFTSAQEVFDHVAEHEYDDFGDDGFEFDDEMDGTWRKQPA